MIALSEVKAKFPNVRYRGRSYIKGREPRYGEMVPMLVSVHYFDANMREVCLDNTDISDLCGVSPMDGRRWGQENLNRLKMEKIHWSEDEFSVENRLEPRAKMSSFMTPRMLVFNTLFSAA